MHNADISYVHSLCFGIAYKKIIWFLCTITTNDPSYYDYEHFCMVSM